MSTAHTDTPDTADPPETADHPETAVAHTRSTISMTTPIGRLDIVAHDEAVVSIWFESDGDGRGADTAVPVRRGEHPVLDRAVAQLEEYFTGTRTDFDLPLDPQGTAFQRQAWEVLRRIPYGETISYGQQAVLLGDKNKSRAVGAANGKNPIPIVVPCHRVVGSNGHLTGFAGGLDTKAWLLDHERSVASGPSRAVS
jgi:methylated-DNA-[protein]-cysteine S-methyltransferase